MVTLKRIYDAVKNNTLSDLAMEVAAKGEKLDRQKKCTKLRTALYNTYDINDANMRFVQHLLEQLETLYQQKPANKKQLSEWQTQVKALEEKNIFDDVFFCFVKKRKENPKADI